MFSVLVIIHTNESAVDSLKAELSSCMATVNENVHHPTLQIVSMLALPCSSNRMQTLTPASVRILKDKQCDDYPCNPSVC